MKRDIALAPHKKEFKENLLKLDLDAVSEIDHEISDFYFDDETELRLKDLPDELPIAIRRRLVALAKEKRRIHGEMQEIAAVFEHITTIVREQKELEEEERKPHCDKCGQVLKKTQTKKRR